jgi:hypothetical protein
VTTTSGNNVSTKYYSKYFKSELSQKQHRAFSSASSATFQADYEAHVADRAAQGIVPLPLNAQQVADLVELLKEPGSTDTAFLIDLLENRIPPGVDEAIRKSYLLSSNYHW